MENRKGIYREIFEGVTEHFWQHLDNEDNTKIILSGMYGVGKSTFIEHFFNEVGRQRYVRRKRFKVFKLYPVNYTISNNEDIFKYIKIDILKHILKSYPDLVDDTIFSDSTVASYLIAHKLGHLVPALFTLIGQIGETDLLSDMGAPDSVSKSAGVFQPLHNMLLNLKQKHDNLKNGSNELKRIHDFLETETHKEGSIYEMNLITNLIIDLVKRLKERDIQREQAHDAPPQHKTELFETVLIIEDLDRLDPNHVFRLFNIFAAHLTDRDETKNKFGFDKIIFVCDVANIRKLYAHFYGSISSFNGYIDKFYSNRIFYFDNIDSLRQIVGLFVEKLKLGYSSTSDSDSKLEGVRSDLSVIFSSFLKNGSISLRSLVKLEDISHTDTRSRYYSHNSRLGLNANQGILLEFDILFMLFHNKDDLYDALQLCKKKSDFLFNEYTYTQRYRYMLYSTLPLLSEGTDNNPLIRTYNSGMDSHYTIEESPSGDSVLIKRFNSLNEEVGLEYGAPAVDLYIEAFHYLEKLSYL